MLAERIQRIGLSPTLRINALAQEMKAAGEDVLDFSAGQPDFPTPQAVKQAGIEAIESDKTRYTANSGLPEFRSAIAHWLEAGRGLRYGSDQILVSPGAKASLYFACMALLEPGDEALLPSPYWVSYPEQVRLAQAEPVFVPCSEETGFKLTVEQLERGTTERTKLLLLNYPSNPTGACYTRDELEPLAEFCQRRKLWVLADEIYSRLLFDGRRFTSIAQLSPEMQQRTIIVDGMSKTYAMTGWRIGYAAGPAEVIAGMARLQSHSTSNATTISQWASLEALVAPQDEVERRVQEFQERRNEIVRRLSELPGVSCRLPEGSFYVFPNVSGCFGGRTGEGTIDSGEALTRFLLERAKVAVVPGEAFGSAAHVRISYAASLERIREGMDRIAAALAGLTPA
jgi:aspartate/methionine/tyrosine aminotransferase